MQEGSDDDKDHYESAGKKVSRKDIFKLLHYAMSVLLMNETRDIENIAGKRSQKIKEGKVILSKKGFSIRSCDKNLEGIFLR